MNLTNHTLIFTQSNKVVARLHVILGALDFDISSEEKDSQTFGESTLKAVQRFQREHNLEVANTVEGRTAELLERFFAKRNPNPEPTGERPSISGQVILDTRLLAQGLTLNIYRQEFGSETLLGTVTTDETGAYRLAYEPTDSPLAYTIRTPEADGKEVSLMGTAYQATAQEVRHLVVPARLQNPPTEFTRLHEALVPYLNDKRLGQAREDEQRADLTYLHEQTTWDARLIALAALADQRSDETDVPSETLYALFRAGLPTSAERLAHVPVARLERALQRTNEVGVTQVDVAASLDQLNAFATRQLRQAMLPGGRASVGDFLQRTGLETEEQDTVADVVFNHTGSRGALWDSLRDRKIPANKVAELKLQGKLAFLTVNNPLLITHLQQITGQGAANPASLVKHGLYRADHWKDEVRELVTDEQPLEALIPDTYSGETPEERLDSYAADMAQKVRQSYPTHTLTSKIENNELNIKVSGEVKTSVQRLLTNALEMDEEQSFVLGTTSLPRLLKEHPDELLAGIAEEHQEATREAVKTLSRLYQLSPTDEAMQVLYDAGITSALDVVSYPFDEWMEHFGNKFDNEEQAKAMYDKGEQTQTVLYNFYTAGAVIANSPPTSATSPPRSQTEQIRKDLIKKFPTLESLFGGSLDYCECEHCRSVLSPAAYLVDLFQFLNPNQSRWDGFKQAWNNKHSKIYEEVHSPHNPYGVLAERRPDLEHLALTCSNTNTALPYVDIVNEVLECYVDKDKLDSSVAYDTGDVSSEALLAEPQHHRPGAYQKLADARYPLTLPFDLPLAQGRAFTQHFNLPYEQLLRTFRQTDELISDSPATGAPYYFTDIFAEQLKLSPGEYRLLIKPNFDHWFKLYGYPDEPAAIDEEIDGDTGQRIDLGSAKTLSRRLGVSYQELVQLVKTHFLHPTLQRPPLLQTLAVEPEDIFRWNNAAGLTFTPVERDVFAERLTIATARLTPLVASLTNTLPTTTDNGNFPALDAEQLLNSAWENNTFDQTLVIFDTGETCSFDQAKVRFANGKPLTSLEWVKLNVFVRLWKKLGWDIDVLDTALVSFVPTDAPLTLATWETHFRTALIYLAHLQQVHQHYPVGRDSLADWTGVWGGITSGQSSVYRRYFLRPTVLQNDPVFDHPAGHYLVAERNGALVPFTWNPDQPEDRVAGNVGLKNHLAAVQAALTLTPEEMALVLALSNQTLNTAPLNRDVLQLLYGAKVLRDATQWPITDLLTLQHLSGLRPLRSLERGAITTLDQDHPYTQTLAFLALVDEVKQSGVSVADLSNLLQHPSSSDGAAPATEAIALVRTLAQEMQRIRAEHVPPPNAEDYTVAFLRDKLVLALSEPVADLLISMWNGTDVWRAIASVNPTKLPKSLLEGESSLNVTYNEIKQEQTLNYRGVVDAAHLSDLKNKLDDAVDLPDNNPRKLTPAQRDLAKTLLEDIAQQAKAYYEPFYQEHIFRPIFEEKQGHSFTDFFFTETPPRASIEQLVILTQATLRYLIKKLTQDYVITYVSETLSATPTLVEYLLREPQVLSSDTKPLMSVYEQLTTPGLSRSFIDGNRGVIQSETKPTVELTATDVPSGIQTIRWEGYLEVAEAGEYRFYVVGPTGAEVTLSFAKQDTPLISGSITNGELSEFTLLSANVPHHFTLVIKNFPSGTIRLDIQSAALPRGNVDRLRLYPFTHVERVEQAYVRLSKTVQLIGQTALTVDEVRYLTEHPAHFYQFDFNALPTQPVGTAQAVSLFAAYRRLREYIVLRDALAGGGTVLAQWLRNVPDSPTPAEAASHTERLGELVRRPAGVIDSVLNHLKIGVNDLATQSGTLRRSWEVLQVHHTVGVPLRVLANATQLVGRGRTFGERFSDAVALREAVKARYTTANWYRVAQPIYDRLRAQQRDALVAYLLQKLGFDRVEQLFDLLLIDPGMEPVVQTSRVRLAISTVQTFVQRCLLNLEPKVSPAAITRSHWEWMKRYRVWEANRKIFLFPENWLEPEFRDDKTHLFQALESTILQGDTRQEVVERAFFDYLKGLEKIARLNLIAMYCEQNPTNPAGNTLHVIGREYGQVKYYHRTYGNGMWTPWVPIPDQIEGEHLALIKWQERLHIFWVTFMPKAESKNLPNEDTEEKTIEQLASEKPSTLVKHQVTVQLNWCEYFQGTWQARETGGQETAILADVKGNFDSDSVFIHASLDRSQNEGEGPSRNEAVLVHLSGKVFEENHTFRIASKLAMPEQGEHEDAIAPPYTTEGKRKTKYQVNRHLLKVNYAKTVTQREFYLQGTRANKSSTTTTGDRFQGALLKSPQEFDLLCCNAPIKINIKGDEGKINGLIGSLIISINGKQVELDHLLSPIFLEANKRGVTFYVEPQLTITTVREWESWVPNTPTPGGGGRYIPDWELPDEGPDFTLPIGPGSSLLDSRELEKQLMGDEKLADLLENPLDWLIQSGGTLVQFGNDLIGTQGRIPITQPGVVDSPNHFSRNGLSGTTNGFTVSPGSSVMPNVSIPVDTNSSRVIELPSVVIIVGEGGLDGTSSAAFLSNGSNNF